LPTVVDLNGRNPFKARIVPAQGGGGGGEAAPDGEGGASPEVTPTTAPTGGGSSFGGTTGGTIVVPGPTVTRTVVQTVETPGPTATVVLPAQPQTMSIKFIGLDPGEDGELGTADDTGNGLFGISVDGESFIEGSVPQGSAFAEFAPLSWTKFTGMSGEDPDRAVVQVGDVTYRLSPGEPQRLF
jgi:hypothetical protein